MKNHILDLIYVVQFFIVLHLDLSTFPESQIDFSHRLRFSFLLFFGFWWPWRCSRSPIFSVRAEGLVFTAAGLRFGFAGVSRLSPV
jgi:hypothetical protein